MRILFLIVPALLLASCTQKDTPVPPRMAPAHTVANSSGEIVINTWSITTVSWSLVQPIR